MEKRLLFPAIICILLTISCGTTVEEPIGHENCPMVKNFVSVFFYPDGFDDVSIVADAGICSFGFRSDKNKTVRKPDSNTTSLERLQYERLSKIYLNPTTCTANNTGTCSVILMPYARKFSVKRTKADGSEEDVSAQVFLQYYTYKEAFLSGLQRRGERVEKRLTELGEDDLRWFAYEPMKIPTLKTSLLHDSSKLTLEITLEDGTVLRQKLY